MPWTAKDATRHTKKATTKRLQELWADAANRALMEHDEGTAIKIANAAVAKATRKKK